MNYIKHFITITKHRRLVRQGCFKVGLYWRGLVHDLSKYMPSEFLVGAKYYQGYRSPNNAEREDIGYSSAWLHHKGRNKHHFEYWMDYSAVELQGFVPAKMPTKYIVEMFMDRVAASKNYNGKRYQDSFPYEYYKRGEQFIIMEDKSKELLAKLLKMLAEQGEDVTFAYIRQEVLKKNR